MKRAFSCANTFPLTLFLGRLPILAALLIGITCQAGPIPPPVISPPVLLADISGLFQCTPHFLTSDIGSYAITFLNGEEMGLSHLGSALFTASPPVSDNGSTISLLSFALLGVSVMGLWIRKAVMAARPSLSLESEFYI